MKYLKGEMVFISEPLLKIIDVDKLILITKMLKLYYSLYNIFQVHYYEPTIFSSQS